MNAVAQTPDKGILLAVKNLNIRFGDFVAVDDLSFTLRQGETLGLVGESGSGKSMTALALMGLSGPEATVSGSILLGGTQVVGLGPQAMRSLRGAQVAMVFQEPMTALNPVMPIGRQVAEGLRLHRPELSRAQVKDLVLEELQAVGLPEPERRLCDYPHQFSGGQRQRILIAMATILRPRLLIADEPTTALDVTMQAQVLELLAGLRERYNLAMLFISHDLAVVAQVAARVQVMRRGVTLEQGETLEVFRNPRHPYTRSLLNAVPAMDTPRNQPLAVLEQAPSLAGKLEEASPGHWVRR